MAEEKAKLISITEKIKSKEETIRQQLEKLQLKDRLIEAKTAEHQQALEYNQSLKDSLEGITADRDSYQIGLNELEKMQTPKIFEGKWDVTSASTEFRIQRWVIRDLEIFVGDIPKFTIKGQLSYQNLIWLNIQPNDVLHTILYKIKYEGNFYSLSGQDAYGQNVSMVKIPE